MLNLQAGNLVFCAFTGLWLESFFKGTSKGDMSEAILAPRDMRVEFGRCRLEYQQPLKLKERRRTLHSLLELDEPTWLLACLGTLYRSAPRT